MNKKNNSLLKRLLHDNKFLFLCALFISLALWVYLSTGNGNDATITIKNIPVQIDLSKDAISNGLTIFSEDEQTVSVTVTGNRAILGSLTQSDIIVNAVTSTIDSSGSYSLSLSATKSNPYLDFKIVSAVTPSTVNVFVDYLRETSFDIQDNLVYKVSDGYYASTALETKSVIITGPQTVVSKISKVAAVATMKDILSATTDTNAKIVLFDSDGKEFTSDLITIDATTVNAKISVLPEKNVNVVPVFVNKPENIVLDDDIIKISPPTILLAGTNNVLDKINNVTLETIDFSNLKNEKAVFNLGIDIPSDCKNISNTSNADVVVDLSSFSSKSITVSKFTVNGLSSKYSAIISQKSIDIVVYGSKEEINNLDASNVTAIIDTSEFSGTVGSVSMPLKFSFGNNNTCWTGNSYKANLIITEK